MAADDTRDEHDELAEMPAVKSEVDIDIDVQMAAADSEDELAPDLEAVDIATAELDVEDVEELDVEELDVDELEVEELDEFELVEDESSESAQAPAPPPMPVTRPPSPAAPPVPKAGAAASPLVFQLVDPAEVSVLDALLEGREQLDWERRAEKLTKELSMAESKSRIGELAYELGELYQRHLGDEASSVKAYGRALQADPSLRANLWAIRRIFYRRKLWPNLVKLIGAELRFATTDRQRADLHLERGRILQDGVGEARAAQEAYEQALALEPTNHSALLALETLAAQCGDSDLLHRTLLQLAKSCTWPERKAAILVELAREIRLGSGDHDTARALLVDATALDCLHEAVDRERTALAREADDQRAIAACLESRIGRLQESFGVAGVPDSEAAPNETGVGNRLREILALRREQAQVLADSGDEDGAWSCLHEALSLMPQEPILLADLSDLAEKLGRYEELAELVEARESGEVDPSRAIGLALRRASALSKAGKQDEADEVLSSRARSYPGYLPLVVARETSAGARTDWAKLAALQCEAADTLRLGTAFGAGADCEPEPLSAAQHYVVAGDLLRFGADDVAGAETLYTLALEVHAGSELAVSALADLLIGTRRYAEAAERLEARLASLSGDLEGADALRGQLAAIYLVANNSESELRCIDGLLIGAPEDASLLGRRVELLRERRSDIEFGGALLALAGVLNDTDAKGALYFEAGRHYARLGQDWSKAAECYGLCRECWSEDPIVGDLELEALRNAQAWEALATCLRDRLDRCEDDEVVGYGREAIWVAEFALENAEGLATLATSLCERAPNSLALLLDALACLDRLGGEDVATADILERLAEAGAGDTKSSALLRLGAVSQKLGREAEAEQAFRSAGEAGSAAGWLALHNTAFRHGEGAVQSEALVALADEIGPGPESASLREASGWGEVARENYEEAAGHFAGAYSDSKDSVGALLGLSLLSAKDLDATAQGEFLESLADVSQGAYARSSLLIHSAMLAEVQGDSERAGLRLAKARSISPQDAGTAVVLADRLEPLRPEGESDRAALLERAELCDMRSVLAEAGSARVDWELERAEALELAGHLQEAILAVSSVLDMRPGHIRGLQTLRRVCIRGGDRGNQARACVALARQLGDEAGKADLLREAVAIFDGELAETAAAVATYQALLAELPGAPEFERLVEILREHGDIRSLYRTYTARLKYMSVEGEHRPRVPLFLARAALRNDIGDIRGAARDLASLLEIDPVHLDALAERARLLERLGEDREAAEYLKQYLAIEAEPEKRAAAELSLAHLLADSLDDIEGAIEQLEHVVRQSPSDIEVRERLVSLLVKAKQIDQACTLIREMSSMRGSDGERARDELRVAGLFRDADNREQAIASLRRARQYDTLNLDALSDLIALAGGETKTRNSLIASGVEDLRQALAERPAEPSIYEKLAIVASWGELEALERQALHALEVVGSLSTDQEASLAKLGEGIGAPAALAAADVWRSALVHRDAGGFVNQLWSVIGPAVAALSGGTPDGLGFERSHRVKGKAVAKEVPEVAKLAGYLQLEGLEVYRSDARGEVARSVTGELPVVCLGGALAKAQTPEHWFALGRCLAHAKAGTGSAADLAEADLDLYVAAAAELAGVTPQPEALAGRTKSEEVAVLARRMAKALGRKGRKELTALAPRFSELTLPITWRVGSEITAARVGFTVCGNLKAAMDVLDVGKRGRPILDAPVGLDLLVWSVSEEFLTMLASDAETEVSGGKSV